jgi:Cu/Zn superoxide dismutase
MSDLEWWFLRFSFLRNKLMHGEEPADEDYKHEGERHLWLGEARLRQAAKRTVAKAGHRNVLQDPPERALAELPKNLDGKTTLRFKTDRFAIGDLFDEDKSAVIVHAGLDNYANISASSSTGGDRYHSHLYDVFGPDADTLKTGDAGARYACGVIRRP